MAGIADMQKGGAQPPAEQPQPSGNPSPAGGAEPAVDDGQQPNVTPEEQAQYDLVMRNALKVIYPEGEGEATVSPNVLQGLQGSDSPVMNLATTTVTLVIGLRDSAKKAGQPIDDDVLFHAGVAITEELAEVAEAAKVHDYSEEEIEQAFYQALDLYRTSAEQSGDINTDELKAQWGELVQADKEGRVGDISPALEQRMREAQQ